MLGYYIKIYIINVNSHISEPHFKEIAIVGLFFNSWKDLGRILVLGVMGYISLVLLLRVSGNRTLSKLNAFDFVITIALGSTFGSLILNKSISLAEGVMAFAVLVGMQYVISWLTIRSEYQEINKK